MSTEQTGCLTPEGADIMYGMGKRGSTFYCKVGPYQDKPTKCVVLSRRRTKDKVTVRFRTEHGEEMTMSGNVYVGA